MGSIVGGTFTYDNGSIKNRHVSNVAADRLDADKSGQLFKPGTCFGFAIGATPTTREEIVYQASGAGTIRGFHASFQNCGSSMSIAFDLKKNNTTVLSSTLTFTNSDASKVSKSGTLSTTTFGADDIITIAMTVTSSTGCVGPYAWVVLDETYCPAT